MGGGGRGEVRGGRQAVGRGSVRALAASQESRCVSACLASRSCAAALLCFTGASLLHLHRVRVHTLPLASPLRPSHRAFALRPSPSRHLHLWLPTLAPLGVACSGKWVLSRSRMGIVGSGVLAPVPSGRPFVAGEGAVPCSVSPTEPAPCSSLTMRPAIRAAACPRRLHGRSPSRAGLPSARGACGCPCAAPHGPVPARVTPGERDQGYPAASSSSAGLHGGA